MTRNFLFDAVGEIDGRFILSVAELLDAPARERASRRRRKRLRTALLLAAALAALAVSAYAAGLFGLAQRLIPPAGAEETSCPLPAESERLMDELRGVYRRTYLSLNGVTGSPEHAAAAAWLQFQNAYAREQAARQLARGDAFYEWRDLERGFAGGDAETLALCRLYGVWDAAMLQRLREIADEHALTLHTAFTPVPARNLPAEDNGYFENGAFVARRFPVVNGAVVDARVYGERPGALPCRSLTLTDGGEYAEWEYATAQGDAVSLAVRQSSRPAPGETELYRVWSILIFYNGAQASITVSGAWQADLRQGAPDVHAAVERLADSFRFADAAAARTPEDALRALQEELEGAVK